MHNDHTQQDIIHGYNAIYNHLTYMYMQARSYMYMYIGNDHTYTVKPGTSLIEILKTNKNNGK